MTKVFFKTFGCRSNLYDTQVMMSSLKDYAISMNEREADIIVINSCTVTNKVDREIRSYARKYTNAGKKIVFTGCGVKHLGKNLFQNNLAHTVFTHSHKEQINAILSNSQKVLLLNEKYKHVDSILLPKIIGKARAFIKIQEGCNFACSYCIIPSVRGVARSFKEKHIIEQIKILAQNNISEVILTGTNIGSYGIDTHTNIATLIRKIHEIDGIKRIRLGSLEPSQIDQTFLDILDLEKLERHLHIAIQHTSPRMLKIMNRKNSFDSDFKLFTTIQEKGFSLGTDYIVGHYGETKEIFQEALDNLITLPLTHIHTFIYSPRVGTKSAQNAEKLEIIKGDIAKNRLKLVESIVKEKNKKFRIQHKMTPLHVLIDGQKNIQIPKNIMPDNFHNSKDSDGIIQCYTGLDQYFNKVFIPMSTLHQSIESQYRDFTQTNFNSLKGKWVEVKDYCIAEHNIAYHCRIIE